MSVAKCHNITGCLLAYRSEPITVAPNAPLVCPECGKPLTVTHELPSGLKNAVIALIVLAILGGAAWYTGPRLTQMVGTISHYASNKGAGESPAPATPAKSGSGAKATPVVAAATPVPPSEPPPTMTRPAHIDLDLAKSETKITQDEVLKRIDLMPNISQANRDKLYVSVHRARSMGLVLTIPFGSGKITLTPPELQQLKGELEKPEIASLRDDPTAVFVVLGYADPKGDEKKNLDISQRRADGVLDAMRDKCGVTNVMHAVAMGGQKLIDTKSLEKNRVVEIWAVLP
jgi:outer membrane protein OmpA-like peptidoglycan-associated protein